MSKEKRNRAINWDEDEKQLFCLVLKDYAPIIENKSLENNSIKRKNQAWEDVHKKFNEINARPRNLNQLKIQWKVMKINARKKINTFKKECNKTGGGGRPATPETETVEIRDLLNPAELLVDENIYDCDGIMATPLHSTPSTKSNVEMCVIPLQDSTLTDGAVEFTIDQNQDNCDQYITSMISQEEKYGSTPVKNINPKKCGKTGISKKDNDYVSSMIQQSKMIKEKEHLRRAEMAEEEHKIKIEILKENLKCAILQRKILEKKYEETL